MKQFRLHLFFFVALLITGISTGLIFDPDFILAVILIEILLSIKPFRTDSKTIQNRRIMKLSTNYRLYPWIGPYADQTKKEDY